MIVLIALACVERSPAAAAIEQRCGAYRGLSDVYGHCIAALAGGFPDADSAEQLCSDAGRWEGDCRAVWVEGRLHPGSGVSTEALLAICGASDCRLDVLDFRADPDLLTQVQRCAAWAEADAPHCVSHAVQRWRATRPGVADLAEISSWDGILADWLGHHLAEAVVCDGVGACGGAAVLASACQDHARALRAGQAPCHDPTNAPRPMQGTYNSNK